MQFTRQQITELAQAHALLDGPKDAPFKFSAKVRYSLAKNLRIFRTRTDDVIQARNQFVRSHVPPGEKTPEQGTPEFEKLDTELRAFLQESEEVDGVMKLTLNDLQLDLNPVPISVLCALGPLVVEDVV